jgi:hypothetical protein
VSVQATFVARLCGTNHTNTTPTPPRLDQQRTFKSTITLRYAMGTLLRRTKPTICYFCQTTISPPPPQPLSFLCPHCACRNHYDANGDILSDDPAMHDESLNRRSFARRGASSLSPSYLFVTYCNHNSACCAASPPKDRLLTTFGSTPFCAACQSNQRLVVGLLSSYLPPSDDVRSRPYALSNVGPGSHHLPFLSSHRTPIMRLASRASRTTRLPSTRATRPSARSARRLSKRRFERRTAWRA